VIEALNRALGLRRVEPETLLLHTDQGSQYRATDYRDLLGKHEIICSMSAKGCCWDNAVVESFFSNLKLELDLDDNREGHGPAHHLQRQASEVRPLPRLRRGRGAGGFTPLQGTPACQNCGGRSQMSC